VKKSEAVDPLIEGEEPKRRKPRMDEIFPDHSFEPRGKKFALISAQNNTDEEKDFLRALQIYENQYGYQIGCFSVVYQNLSPFTSKENREFAWSASLLPYMISEPIQFNSKLEVFPHIRPAATTRNPLQGLLNRSPRSIVIPTNRPHVLPVASPADELPSYFIGTGSATVANFRVGGPGAKAQPGHSVGALILEILDDEQFFWRHIQWDGTGFYDLDRYVTAEGITTGHRAANLVWGDIHAEELLPSVWRAARSISALTRPLNHTWHDVIDFEHGHHQSLMDRLKNPHRHTSNSLKIGAQAIEQHRKDFKGSNLVIVSSNHHQHLDGWLDRYDPRKWPADFDFYTSVMSRVKHDKKGRDAFYHAISMYASPKAMRETRFLNRTESFIMHGIDFRNHGHVAANGARGGPQAFSAMTYRQICGHTHKLFRNDNYASSGTSGEPSASYSQGYDSNDNGKVLVYPNGKFTHLALRGDKWRS
jgi:hypothetical protein